MGHTVPLLPGGDIFNPVIGGQIDNLNALGQKLWCLLHGDAVRRGKKHHITGAQISLGRIFKRQIHSAPQVGKHLGHRQARIAARRNGFKFNLRVRRQQTQQFHTRVACTTNNPDLDHFFILKINAPIIAPT